MRFNQDNLNTKADHSINTLILEQASDTAEKLTELECKLNNIECWVYGGGGQSFTDEAQDIFNIYYDEQCEELYNLLNAQLKELGVTMDCSVKDYLLFTCNFPYDLNGDPEFIKVLAKDDEYMKQHLLEKWDNHRKIDFNGFVLNCLDEALQKELFVHIKEYYSK